MLQLNNWILFNYICFTNVNSTLIIHLKFCVMKFCPQCGSALKEGSKFCASCGFRVDQPQIENAHHPTYDSPTSARQPFYPTTQPESIPSVDAEINLTPVQTGLIQRVIGIITNPKHEWLVIKSEKPRPAKLVLGYALILTFIPAISTFLVYGVIGLENNRTILKSIPAGLIQGGTQLISSILGVFLFAWMIDKLAPLFDSERNFGRSLQLAVYSTTAQWLAGVFLMVSGAKWLTTAAGLYAIYLLATGLPVLKGTPKNKVAWYVITALIGILVIAFVLSLMILAIFETLFTSAGN